jgi:hypothetical protein
MTLDGRMRLFLMATLIVALFHRPSVAAEADPSGVASRLPFAPSAFYKPMFDRAREWHFHVETISEDHDPDDPRAKGGVVRETVRSSATCRVTKVVRWASSIGSRIECTGPLSRGHVEDTIPAAGGFLEGDWIVTAKGLWRFDLPVLDGPEPAVEPKDMIIAAKPSQMETESTEGVGGGLRSGQKGAQRVVCHAGHVGRR